MKKFSFSKLPRGLYLYAAVFAFAGLGTFLVSAIHASGNATLKLTQSSTSVSLGNNLVVTIVEGSSTVPVNAVEADLTYDQTKLQFVSIDTSTSPFSLVAASSGGNGTVTIANAAMTPQTGNQTVAIVTFKAIGIGNNTVNFAGTSGIAQSSDNTNVLGTATGTTYTVNDGTAPTVPTSLKAGALTATTVAISWTASTDNVGVTGYKIYRGATQIGTTPTTSYTDTGLSPSNNYSYTVAAYDSAGNTSAKSTSLSASTTADTTAPSVPSGLVAGTKTLTSIALTWTASTDNVGVTGYKVFRGATQIGTTATTSYTDTGLTAGTAYSYTVSAYDAANNNSSKTVATNVSTQADTTAPSIPAGLTSTGRTTSAVSLSWTASTDNVGVTGYKVYRNGTQVGTSATTSYTDTGLTSGVSYAYTIAAYDAAGNTSAKSVAKSYAPTLRPGDANSDGKIDYLDLSLLANAWLSKTDLRADFNSDGVVNYLDLSILASNWGM